MGIIASKVKDLAIAKVKSKMSIIPGNDPVSRTINLVTIATPIVLTGAFATVSPKLALKFATTFAGIMILTAIYSKAKNLPFWTYRQ